MEAEKHEEEGSSGFYMLMRTSTEFGSLEEEYKFYHIVDNDRSEDEVIDSVLGMDFRSPKRDPTIYCHGSKLYFLGGLNMIRRSHGLEIVRRESQVTNEFWYFDLDDHVYRLYNSDDCTVEVRRSTIAFKQGPSMIDRRSGLSVAAVDQKIYVFSGEVVCKLRHDGEVYDFQTDNWSPLEIDVLLGYPDIPPPEMPTKNVLRDCCITISAAIVWHDKSLGADSKFNTLILLYVAYTGFLYSYNTCTTDFEVFDPHFGSHREPPFALSCNDDVLLVFDQGNDDLLHGYHLRHKKWSIVSGLEGDKMLPQLCPDYIECQTVRRSQHDLFSLDDNTGKVCLIWGERMKYLDPYRFFYTKFTVEEIVKGETIFLKAANVEPVQTFLINDAHKLICCLNLEHGKRALKRSATTSEMEIKEQVAAEE